MDEHSKGGHSSNWLDTLTSHRGRTVRHADSSFLFRFYTEDESAALIRDWHHEIGLTDFDPIGSFCSGDFVCAHPHGTLFIVLHDTMEWWDSAVTFEELIQRLEATDLELEEDVYSRQT